MKIALISETLNGPDKLWTAGGVYAAVAASRAAAVTAAADRLELLPLTVCAARNARSPSPLSR